METIEELGRANAGIVTTRQLTASGYASHHLTAFVRSGVLVRLRNGWYALPDAHPDVARAVRVGGRLAGISGAAWYGLATPERYALHVQVAANASRLRSPNNRRMPLAARSDPRVVTHWQHSRADSEPLNVVVPLAECLRQVVLTESEEDAVACLDSALRRQFIDRIDLELLRASLPKRYRRILDLTDGRSDGYPESIARRRFARAGVPTQIQVKVLDERWIDIVIGDRLAIEIDGRGKYLSEPTPEAMVRRFAEEKQRDAFLVALGFLVVHITYDMLMDDWDATLAMILAIMERGDHLHRPDRRHSKQHRGVSSRTRRSAPAVS